MSFRKQKCTTGTHVSISARKKYFQHTKDHIIILFVRIKEIYPTSSYCLHAIPFPSVM